MRDFVTLTLRTSHSTLEGGQGQDQMLRADPHRFPLKYPNARKSPITPSGRYVVCADRPSLQKLSLCLPGHFSQLIVPIVLVLATLSRTYAPYQHTLVALFPLCISYTGTITRRKVNNIALLLTLSRQLNAN